MELNDREYWLRYCRDAKTASTQIGIEPIKWQRFKFSSPSGYNTSQSMLSVYEMGLLYALARNHYQGHGAIIDAGPLLGASTFALARGLADNPTITDAQRKSQIYSYDLFRSHGYEKFLGDLKPAAVTGSLLPEFVAINRDYLDSIVIHQGDFMSWAWPNEPIEILFLDLAKSWALNAHAIKQMFPCLIPGKSILIQQDYVHFNEYWIHITMEHFSECFRPLGFIWGATAYYACERAPTKAEASVDLKALSYERKMELLTSARQKAPLGVQQVMKCAAAKCAIEHGQLGDTETLLADVDLAIKGEHQSSDFSGIAKSNRDYMLDVLKFATDLTQRNT